jgi:lysophospholipase L1-like esterase
LEQIHHIYHDIALAVLLIGGNDLKTDRTFDSDTFAASLNRISALLLRYDPKPSIVLCTIPVPGPHPALPADSPHTVRMVLNPLIRETAFQRNLPLCELENIFDDCPSLRSDGVHPTAAGDRLLADAIGEIIISNLKSISGGTP